MQSLSFSTTESTNSRNHVPIISSTNLNHYFGQGSLRKQVLFDINLKVYPGEIVIMTGPSGSGKTTLLTLMGALRSVQEGSLKILNQEMCGATSQKMVQIRRQIGYVFQAHNLLKFLTAQQNVRMSLELHSSIPGKQLQEKSAAILKTVGLEHRMNYYPDSLSGGQKQRVAIARALVSQPQIVLADEPTAALDKKSGRDVVVLMERLAKEQGCTIVLVTHDHRILDIANRIIHMEDGYLVEDDLTESPQKHS
jgi:putative ABC transport system ATP-binding protein